LGEGIFSKGQKIEINNLKMHYNTFNFVVKTVENMDKNRIVSENKESNMTRGTLKNVSYADIVKNGKSSNDMKNMNKNR
jgi:hypothetical protein